jgi:hypothetical protein
MEIGECDWPPAASRWRGKRRAREARAQLFHTSAVHAVPAQAQDDAPARGLISQWLTSTPSHHPNARHIADIAITQLLPPDLLRFLRSP